MPNVKIVQAARIAKNGGPISSDRYQTDGTNALKQGALCYISAGTLIPVRTSAGKLENDAAPFDAANEYAIAPAAAAADAGYVAAQRVTPDTVFEGYVVDATGTDVAMDTTDIGTVVEGYVDAAGKLAVNNATTKGIFVIHDVDVNYDPYRMGGDFEKDEDGVRHQRVLFKLIDSKLL